MKLLTNLPLECFESRDSYPEFEVVTYGPPDRMWVDNLFYPADVEFDPARGTVHELFRKLPEGFRPDALLIYWPDQEPLPRSLEESPVPVVGVLSDYNLMLPSVSGLWPFFDLFLVDRAGVELFQRLSFADVRYFCQFTFKAPSHRLYPEMARDLDLVFAGNLNRTVQPERAPWLERLLALREQNLAVEVQSGIFGADYGRFLNRGRIGFNRSVRGEMNLRAFEVPACGGLLFMEEENLEVRDFFVPGEEVVLYDENNFEDLVVEHLADRPRCERMAAAGHRRVQQHSMASRLRELARLLETCGACRPRSTAAQRQLGRGTAMLTTWAEDEAVLEPLVAAHKLAPDDPRPLNAMAVALLTKSSVPQPRQAVLLLQQAHECAPHYLPAAANLAWLFDHHGQERLAEHYREALAERATGEPGWLDIDGVLLPSGFDARNVAHARALAEAARRSEPDRVAQLLLQLTTPLAV